MIELFEKKSDCCGCGACVQVCPKKAISLKEDEYGFWYPVIDGAYCVGCGACKKVCSYQHDGVESFEPFEVYAVSNMDAEKLKQSTSGGVFPALATSILSKGGVVYGATMEYDGHQLVTKHIKIESINELFYLQGSKYVQSDVGNCYSEIKDLLRENQLILFSGTPCQVAALKKFLDKDYDNLYTIDIVCHGVPNQKMFSDYIRMIEKKNKCSIERFEFRTKKFGWGLDGQYFYKVDRKMKSKRLHYRLSSFYSLFIDADIYRENCYSCKYANVFRISDITIGDYWGIETEHPEILTQNGGIICEEKGISCVLINTKRGKNMFNMAKNNMYVFNSTLEKVQAHNGQLNYPAIKGKNRETVLALYKKGSYEYVDDWFWKQLGVKKIYYYIRAYMPKGLKKMIKRIANRTMLNESL